MYVLIKLKNLGVRSFRNWFLLVWFEPLPSSVHVVTMNQDESSLADSLTHVLGP